MILIARLFLPMMAAFEAYFAVVIFLHLALTIQADVLLSIFDWCLLSLLVGAAALGIYSFAYYFIGDKPRRQIQVLFSAGVYLVTYFLFQSPAAPNFLSHAMK